MTTILKDVALLLPTRVPIVLNMRVCALKNVYSVNTAQFCSKI